MNYHKHDIARLPQQDKEQDKEDMCSLFNHSAIANCSVTLDGKIWQVNQAFIDLFACSKYELIGESIGLIDTESKTLESMFNTIVKSSNEHFISGETQLVDRYNKEHLMFISMTKLVDFYDNQDGIVVQIIQISGKKDSDDETVSARDFNEIITEVNPDLIFVKDEQFRIVFANSHFLSHYPKEKRDNVIGSTTLEEYDEEEVALFLKEDKRAFKEGRSRVTEAIQFPGGKNKILETTKIRFESASKKPFILGISRDVTEREILIKQLKKSNEDLKQFAYIASHDLKSPINAISQLASWVYEDCSEVLPDESKKHLQLMSSRSKRLLALLNDLLNYSRLEVNNYVRETISIKSLAENTLDLLSNSGNFKLNAADVDLNLPRIPVEIIFRNLISNSLKHHDTGKGLIEVNYHRKSNFHVLCYQDDGPGIPEKLRSKAVEMFQTLKPRDKVEGSGMGLAVIKKIVEANHGQISLESNEPKGFRLIIKWPIEDVQASFFSEQSV